MVRKRSTNNLTIQQFNNFSSQRGQTLVEVLAGLGMILIVVTALIGMGVVALKASTSARNRTVAAKLANEGMEIARSVRDQGTLADVVDFDDSVTIGSAIFTRERRVSGPADERTIVVTVKWDESSGEKSVSVTSYLTDWR